MIVLHFIPDLAAASASNLLRYKPALLQGMAEYADVHVLTSDAGKLQPGAVTVHACPRSFPVPGMGRRFFGKVLAALRPDVVHIHACWSFAAYILFRECEKRRIPTVLTVDRRLERWHYLRRYWLCRLPEMLLFQRHILRNAGALHAVNSQEAATLAGICWHPSLKSRHPLNGRIVEIRAFNLTGGMTAGGMADSLLALYRKVADSLPFPQMTGDELLVEDELIAVGASLDPLHVTVSPEVASKISSLGEKSWRRIFLHSADEGVYDYVYSALKAMRPSLQPFSPASVRRFQMHGGDAAAQKRVAESRKLAGLKADKSLSGVELDVCTAFITLALKVRRSCAHRADFVRVCRLLRNSEYNEDLVDGKMRSLGFGKEVPALLQILKERYGLGEGFMFTEPCDGKRAKKLRTKLYKSDIQ